MDSPKSSNDNASKSNVVKNLLANSIFSLNCRSIRFGTLHTSPNGAGFHFTTTGIVLFFRWSDDSSCNQPTRSYERSSGLSQYRANERTFKIFVDWRHIKELQYYIGLAFSVIFVSVNSFVGHRFRTLFNMVEHADGTYPAAYFDSDSQNMYHRFITVVANATRPQDHQRLEHTLERLDFKSAIITALDFKTASRQLSLTMPPIALSQRFFQSDESTRTGLAMEDTLGEEEASQSTRKQRDRASAAIDSSDQSVAKKRDKSFTKSEPVGQPSIEAKANTGISSEDVEDEESSEPRKRSLLIRSSTRRASKPYTTVVLHVQPGSRITVDVSDSRNDS